MPVDQGCTARTYLPGTPSRKRQSDKWRGAIECRSVNHPRPPPCLLTALQTNSRFLSLVDSHLFPLLQNNCVEIEDSAHCHTSTGSYRSYDLFFPKAGNAAVLPILVSWFSKFASTSCTFLCPKSHSNRFSRLPSSV